MVVAMFMGCRAHGPVCRMQAGSGSSAETGHTSLHLQASSDSSRDGQEQPEPDNEDGRLGPLKGPTGPSFQAQSRLTGNPWPDIARLQGKATGERKRE